MVDYLLSHADELNIEYLIWRQTYIPAHGERSRMQDRGGDTANHYDHVHVTTVGHGFPTGALHLIAPARAVRGRGVGSAQPGAHRLRARRASPRWVTTWRPGSVPPEFAPWLRQGRTAVPADPPVAARGADRAGVRRVRPRRGQPGRGAWDPAQFMPGTWPGYGRDDDGNGTVSPFDIGDGGDGAGPLHV